MTSVTTVAIALVAGASPAVALAAGLSMLALQASIGAYNDLLDVEDDAATQPTKPIPSGAVGRVAAVRITVIGMVIGLLIAASFSERAFALAAAGTAMGYVHSRWTKGTALMPIPFGVGVALLPLYGWAVAAGSLPPSAGLVVALGIVGGLALGLANAAADRDRGEDFAMAALEHRLGPTGIRLATSGLLVAFVVIGLLTLVELEPGPPAIGLATIGVALLGVGAAAPWRPPARPDLAWEVPAAGMACLGLAWLLAAAAA